MKDIFRRIDFRNTVDYLHKKGTNYLAIGLMSLAMSACTGTDIKTGSVTALPFSDSEKSTARKAYLPENKVYLPSQHGESNLWGGYPDMQAESNTWGGYPDIMSEEVNALEDFQQTSRPWGGYPAN